MNRTILPVVLIFLGLQFHGVSAGDLGVQRWSNRLNHVTGTLALEPQKKPAPETTPEGNPSEFVAVKEFYWTKGPCGEPVFVHNQSLQHQSAESRNKSSPTDSGYSSGDEGRASRPDDQTLKTQKPLEASAKNHQRELYWGTDARGNPLLIRKENPPDEPPVLIKHNIISCEGDDCEEDFQNNRGSEHKDLVFVDSAEIPSEDSPEEPGDLEETTSDAESDHFSENDSQERGTWSPDGDSEIRAEENNPETSKSSNGERSPDGATETPGEQNAEEENDLLEISESSDQAPDHENDETRDKEHAPESLDRESDSETAQQEQAGNQQEEDSSAADTSWKNPDPVNDGHTVEAGEDTGDLFDDFSSWTQKASEDGGIPKAPLQGPDIGDLFDDFSSWTQ